MNSEQLKDLIFYCWQLNIRTLKQLAEFKAQHKATTNSELLKALCKVYNSQKNGEAITPTHQAQQGKQNQKQNKK